MRAEDYRVLVVGAGIAGLAAARALRDWGATVEVVERTPAASTNGAGIYLPGNAFRALEGLGLDAPVLAASVRIAHQRFMDHRGRLLVDVDMADAWRGVGPCLALSRTALHEVLLRGAEGVPIRWGRTPAAITDAGGGAITDAGARASVRLDDGTTGSYDLVVGADGVRSTVRRLAFDGAAARPVGQQARRFVVDWPDPEPVWSVHLGRGTAFLTLPIGGNRLYCYCDGPAVASPPLRELFGGYAAPVPALLDALESAGVPPHSGANEEVALASWSRGPVLLVGDAAHATSPNMAEGAAMALEDALVLAESLDAATTTAEALRGFEARRRPRTDSVLARTRRRDRTRTLPTTVRNLFLRLMGQRMYRADYEALRQKL